jgi:hypothetical protein
MITFNSKNRLEQEISSIITFICEGRNIFFEMSGESLSSEDVWFNHFDTKDIFSNNSKLIQTDINVQMLYIKLYCYYELIKDKKLKDSVKVARLAFAHSLNDSIFNGEKNYNYFLHKVSKNFNRFCYVFYTTTKNSEDSESKSLDLELDKDINNFLTSWQNSNKEL